MQRQKRNTTLIKLIKIRFKLENFFPLEIIYIKNINMTVKAKTDFRVKNQKCKIILSV